MSTKAVSTNRNSAMVLQGKGKFMNRPTRTGGRTYDKFFIYVPTELARDSSFPFKSGDTIEMHVQDQSLVIRKAE